MTDIEILKNYADEYCDVLNCYSSSVHKYCYVDNMCLVECNESPFAVVKIEESEHLKEIAVINKIGIFLDAAPFTKKEVSCED